MFTVIASTQWPTFVVGEMNPIRFNYIDQHLKYVEPQRNGLATLLCMYRTVHC